MKFVCLVYFNEAELAALSAEEWKALNEECADCGEDLQRRGHYLAGQPLQPTTTARTLRVRNGKASIVDGPFAETKEQLAGFYMLEARNIDHAVELAQQIPPARYGSIEIRPTRELAEIIDPR